MKSKAVLLSSLVALLPLLSPGFDLVKDGKAAEIVLPEKPHPSTLLAAQELADYTEKVTGKKPAVVKGKSSASAKVFIGTLDTLKDIPASAVKALKEAKQDEAHFICAKGNALYIIGKQEVADLYATYQFIEDKLGVRYLNFPDKVDEGEYVPKKAQISFPDYEKFREPAFAVRRIDQGASFGSVIPVRSKIWANRNGYQTPAPYGTRIPYEKPESERCKFYSARIPRSQNAVCFGGHMTFSAPMPAKTTFDKHPEYFALIDGKRVKGQQYCISNPEVRKNVADFIIRALDAHGGKGAYLFGMVDVNGGWCECPECKKLDGSDTTARGFQNVSTRFFKTVRAIAEMVYAKYPDADLRVWAYHTYRELPDGVTIHPKMKVQYCPHGRCYGHALDDPNCPKNVSLYKLLLGWLKLAPGRIYTYDYFMSSHAYYCCEELVQAKDLVLYNKLGLIGYKEEGCFPDSKFYPPRKNDIRGDWKPSNWQWSYTTAKLLWDPDQDLNKLLDEVESLYYGKAYPAMKKYHALRRKLWSATPQCFGYPHGDGRVAYVLNVPGSKEELTRLLDEAEKLAEGDKRLLHRIGKDRHYLTDYWIKPNDKLKETATKVMRAPTAASKVVIDGDGSDPAWVGAYYLTDGLKQTFTQEKKDIPAALQTTLGILSDSDNLYFLVTAKEPRPDKMKVDDQTGSAVWGKDGIELFLYPPTAANSYYHLGINPNGTFCDALNNDAEGKNFNIPVEVKTKIHKDRYVIEARVPLAKLKKPERGEIWRIFFARNRKVDDELTPGKETYSGHFSLDGSNYHNTAAYRPLEIGTPHLRNGSFEDLDKNGKPKFWILRQKAEVAKTGNGNVLKLGKGEAYHLLYYGDLHQSPAERKISFSLTASGKGKMYVYFVRYTDTRDPKAKNGYVRKIQKRVPEDTFSFTLAENPKVFSGEYTIRANEWVGLFISGADAVVDDVFVRLVK
ncbi:MAG: DUF4838 domain-containing protein [Lentisphaeria bacterium]|nr:DUF4838 domain-containing protein [Lentisphaeria bacterium]